MHIKKHFGLIITFAIAIIPIALWKVFCSVIVDTSSTISLANAFARAAALAAFSLFAFNIILSARLTIFEKVFLGLDRNYRAHRLIGGSVLILLLAHAMLVTYKYSAASLAAGYEFLKPGSNLAISIGSLTLFAMIALVGTSILLQIKYQRFVVIQKLLGGLILFGGYHMLFAKGSDVSSNIPLLIYLGTLWLFAICLYVFRSIFYKSIKKKYQYTVSSVKSKQNITQIWLKPKTQPITYNAGQFAFFQFISKAVDDEPHPFSFASDSNASLIRLAIKADGNYTSRVDGIKAGDRAIIEGPYGYFNFSKITGSNQVWVAGGIGVTPFLALAHSLPQDKVVTLYYCVRTKDLAIFSGELEQIANHNSNFKVTTICSDTDGQLDGNKIIGKKVDDYLFCAPPAFMHSLAKRLKENGINNDNIHFEEFGLR